MKKGFLDIKFLKRAGVIITVLLFPLLPLRCFISVLFYTFGQMFIFLGKIPILQNFKSQQRGKMFKCPPVAKVLAPYFAVNFILY